MDDVNFHQNLQDLKQRISDLTSKYPAPTPQKSSSPSNMSRDAFSSQVQDLRAHVDGLKSSLMRQAQIPHPYYSQYPGAAVQPQGNITLPSAPIFWDLFDSLRTDFRGLDGRLAALEQNVSDLEDRIDSLDPNRFTPPESTTVSEAPSWPLHNNTNTVLPTELNSQIPNPVKAISSQNGYIPVFNSAAGPNAAAYAQNQHPQCLMNQQQSRNQPFLQPYPHEIWQSLQPWIQPIARNEDRLTADMAKVNAAISHLQEDNEEWKNRCFYLGQQVRNLDRAVKDLLIGGVGQKPKDRNDIVKPEVAKKRSNYGTDSVAFRDQEIARMDEQLQITLERLRLSDEAAAEKEAMISDLQSERKNHDARLEEWNEMMRSQIREQVDKIKQRTQENDALRKQIEDGHQALETWSNNYADLNEALKESESKNRALQRALVESDNEHAAELQKWSQSYENTRIKFRDCEHAFREYREDKAAEIERLAVNQAKEMKGLQEFCEQKDAVIHKQERLLSQGGKLFEERDVEIDELQRKLKAAKDDKDHALRTQARVERLLEERDGELARLRDAPKGPVVRWSDLQERKDMESNEPVAAGMDERQLTMSTMGTDGSIADQREHAKSLKATDDSLLDGQRDSAYVREVEDLLAEGDHAQPTAGSDVDEVPPTRAPMWSPRPARRFKRPQHSEHAPYFWGNSVREPLQQEEKWLSFSEQRRQAQKHRDLRRRGRGEGRLRREPNHSPPHPRDGEAFVLSEQRRPKRPSDDSTFWPPLPAPVTARRMASEADLRTGSPNNTGGRAMRSLSKHQSMQDLPNRNRLQAYVTTESAENSGGEFGGEV